MVIFTEEPLILFGDQVVFIQMTTFRDDLKNGRCLSLIEPQLIVQVLHHEPDRFILNDVSQFGIAFVCEAGAIPGFFEPVKRNIAKQPNPANIFLMKSNSNAEIRVLVHIELAGLNPVLAGVQQLWQTAHPLSQTG